MSTYESSCSPSFSPLAPGEDSEWEAGRVFDCWPESTHHGCLVTVWATLSPCDTPLSLEHVVTICSTAAISMLRQTALWRRPPQTFLQEEREGCTFMNNIWLVQLSGSNSWQAQNECPIKGADRLKTKSGENSAAAWSRVSSEPNFTVLSELPAIREAWHYCCLYRHSCVSCPNTNCFLQIFLLKGWRYKALRINHSKKNKGQNLKTMESKCNFLHKLPNPKNTTWVTNGMKFILELLSSSCMVNFKRHVYSADLELSQMSPSGRRQELWGNRSVFRSSLPLIIFSHFKE